MDRKKIIVFMGILILSIVFLFSIPIKNFIKNIVFGNNEPQVLELNSGTYTIGKEVKAGIYDFTVTKGVVRLDDMTAFKGDKIQRIELYDKSYFEIEKKGTVTISKAKEEALIPNKNVYTIYYGGTYIVGLQIPTGDYEVKYNSSVEREEPILIQTSNIDGNIIYDSFEVKTSFKKIKLKSNSVLDITLSKEKKNENIEIIMIKK